MDAETALPAARITGTSAFCVRWQTLFERDSVVVNERDVARPCPLRGPRCPTFHVHLDAPSDAITQRRAPGLAGNQTNHTDRVRPARRTQPHANVNTIGEGLTYVPEAGVSSTR